MVRWVYLIKPREEASGLDPEAVHDAGTSSVKVRLVTEREDLRTREREKTTESYFVYVAIDDENRPTTVPELTVDSETGERLRRDALEGEADGNSDKS